MRSLILALHLIFLAVLTGCEAKDVAVNVPNISVQNVSGDKFVNVNGLDIRYKDNGIDGKPILLLLHGFTSSLDSWNGLVEILGADYRIIRIDLPGHGLTGPDPQHRYSHDDFTNVIHGVINELGLEKPILIGNSMGGNIAWHSASAYPDDIQKLVLIDASGFELNGLSDEPLPLPPMLESYFLKPTKFAINYGLKNQYSDNSKISKDRADKILEMMAKPGNGEAFVEIFKNFTLPDPTEKLSKITVPTLIIWGEKDKVVPPGHAELFHKAITHSKVQLIENSGHVSQEENPSQTAQFIDAFIQEQ